MPGLRESRMKRASDYILAHLDESKEEQAIGAGVSVSLIGLARAALIKDGKLAPSRKGETGVLLPEPGTGTEQASAAPVAPVSPVRTPAGMLDHQAMQAMADMIDQFADENGEIDDAKVHKKLLRQCLTFAFNPGLHPDTRMSASQMWSKLRDQAKSHALGPGKPLTYEDGVLRLADMMKAAGSKMTLDAINRAFDVQETPNAKANDEAPTTVGTAQAPGTVGHTGTVP